jgi:hypothetical protein
MNHGYYLLSEQPPSVRAHSLSALIKSKHKPSLDKKAEGITCFHIGGNLRYNIVSDSSDCKGGQTQKFFQQIYSRFSDSFYS